MDGQAFAHRAPVGRFLRRFPRPGAVLIAAFALALPCAATANGEAATGGESASATGSPGPSASASEIDAMEGAVVQGGIRGLEVVVTSALAYRDWMPGGGGFRAEDGGSALHVMIGLTLTNSGANPLTLTKAARLGEVGGSLAPIAVDDVSGLTVWPLAVAPGTSIRLQVGTREGPALPVASTIALELDLIATSGDSVVISFSSLAIGRTD